MGRHVYLRSPAPVPADCPIALHSFGKPTISTEIKRTIRELAGHGLEVCLIDNLGTSIQMRDYLGFSPEHWSLCSFSGGSPPRDLPGINELVFSVSNKLASLNVARPSLRMPLINGGGNTWMPPLVTGMMGQWTGGLVQAGFPVYGVITDKLILKEGLPPAPGIVFCLLTNAANNRLGQRTDGLILLADGFIIFPGGLGTKSEFIQRMTGTSVAGKPNGKPVLVVNPVIRDDVTGKDSRYFNLFLRSCASDNRYGEISNAAIENLNNQLVLYNPRKGATVEEMTEDVLSLILTIRDLEANSTLQKGLAPLSQEVLTVYTQPLNEGNTISRPFPNRKSSGPWFEALSARLAIQPTKSGRIYRPVHAAQQIISV
ncbi:MAG: LOG family protein [Bdellovibrionales bacterium]